MTLVCATNARVQVTDMNDQEIKELLVQVLEHQQQLTEQLAKQKAGKDFWDRLGALAPIVSAVIIACVGAYFTYTFNQQQLRVQEIQTIEKFIPHLAGSEQSKRAAILAMSSLGDTKVAAKVASIFASEGTVSALHSIAATTTDPGNKEEVIASLTKALETISDKYHQQNQTEQAIAASTEALSLREKSVTTDSASILRNLERLVDLYKTRGDNAMVEDLLKRTLVLQQKVYGPDSPQAANTAKQLAQLPKQGVPEAKVSAAPAPKSATAPAETPAFKPANYEVVPVESQNGAPETAPAVESSEAAPQARPPVHVRLIEKRKVADTATSIESPPQ